MQLKRLQLNNNTVTVKKVKKHVKQKLKQAQRSRKYEIRVECYKQNKLFDKYNDKFYENIQQKTKGRNAISKIVNIKDYQRKI